MSVSISNCLPIHPSGWLPVCFSGCRSASMFASPFVWLTDCPPVFLNVKLTAYPSIWLAVSLFLCLAFCQFVHFSVCFVTGWLPAWQCINIVKRHLLEVLNIYRDTNIFFLSFPLQRVCLSCATRWFFSAWISAVLTWKTKCQRESLSRTCVGSFKGLGRPSILGISMTTCT